MLMGIGNLTELTAADSTGVNALLIAVCQELGVRTVLTTEVIPWARGAVREVDIARRLMHYAVTRAHGAQGRGRSPGDRQGSGRARLQRRGAARPSSRASPIPSFRIFTDETAITVLNHERFVRSTDVAGIAAIFAQLAVDDPTHAFYLGKELARASLAVALGKTYRQEGALAWGYLTPRDDVKSEHARLTHPRRRRSATKTRTHETRQKKS